MTAFLRLTLILCALLTGSCLEAQTWQWMRTGVPNSSNTPSYPVYNILDGQGNTFCVSFNDNVLLTKYDPYGNVLWTRTIVSPAPAGATGNSASITTAVSSICTDANGNLYMFARPFTSIDGRPMSTPGPLWSAQIRSQRSLSLGPGAYQQSGHHRAKFRVHRRPDLFHHALRCLYDLFL